MSDLNRDGFFDLLTANGNRENVSVFLGRGDGTFQTRLPTVVDFLEGLALGDLNGDGKLDAVTSVSGLNQVSVLLGNGDGTFQAHQIFAAGSEPRAVAIRDLNGDDKLDLVVANKGSANVSVLLGNGDGIFQSQQQFSVGGTPRHFPSSVAVDDLNGDGILDISIGNQQSNDVVVLLGNGDGTFQGPRRYVSGSASNGLVRPMTVAVGDMNGDVQPDLVTANSHSSDVVVLLHR